MKIIKCIFNDAYLIAPDIYEDERGYFYESFNTKVFNEIVGFNPTFVQDNHSYSKKAVLRGLHYQKEPYQQDKLVQALVGEVYDVIVDLRKKSETFGKWHAEILSSANKRQIWVPKGFAHGFMVKSDEAIVLYKTTNYYHPEHESTIKYDDPTLNISWPCKVGSISEKDADGIYFKDLF